jgi:hypothetical protein
MAAIQIDQLSDPVACTRTVAKQIFGYLIQQAAQWQWQAKSSDCYIQTAQKRIRNQAEIGVRACQADYN